MKKIKITSKRIIILFSILGICFSIANSVKLSNNLILVANNKIDISTKEQATNGVVESDKDNDANDGEENSTNNKDIVGDSLDDEYSKIDAESLLQNLDLSALEKYFNSLTQEQKNIFGGSIVEFIKTSLNGTVGNYDTFGDYVLSLLRISIKSVLPTILTIVGIATLISLLGSVRGSFASKSVDDLVHFAGISIISLIVIFEIFSIIQRK